MDVILSRRSIRKYTSQPVAKELVKELLECAMSAPSAHNRQPWQFVVIDDRSIMDAIPKFHPYSKMLAEAPVAILVCGDEHAATDAFRVQDCAAATENILIGAHARGLGAVWLGVYPKEDLVAGIRRMVNTPEHIVPFALVSVGYPAEQKPPSNRYDGSRVHWNKW